MACRAGSSIYAKIKRCTSKGFLTKAPSCLPGECMEYIYASLLLHAAGKEITEDSLKKVLEAAGVQVDEARLKALVAALKEVNIDEAIKSAALPMAAPAAPAAAPAEEKKEEKKEEEEEEEKKEAVSEEELSAGLGALFG